VRFGRVPVLIDEGVIAQQALDPGALHALAASVNQPDLREARRARLS